MYNVYLATDSSSEWHHEDKRDDKVSDSDNDIDVAVLVITKTTVATVVTITNGSKGNISGLVTCDSGNNNDKSDENNDENNE